MQYPSYDACISECDAWPLGDTSEPADINTRQCRWNYIAKAQHGDQHLLEEVCPAASGLSRRCGDLCQSLCNYVDGRGRCASLVPSYNAPYGGAACAVLCPYMTDLNASRDRDDHTSGNTINCRAWYAVRGQWHNNTDDCLAASLSSVHGKCTSDTTLTTDASVATYCDNHISACGLQSDSNPSGQYVSLASCIEQATSLPRATYRNQFIGNNLECRLNFAFQAVDPIWHNDTCRDTGMRSLSYCNDQACSSYCAISQYACGNVSADDYDPSYACTIDWCPSFPNRADQVNATSGDSLQCRVTYANAALTDPTQCRAAGVVSYQANTTSSLDACGSVYDVYCDFIMDGCGSTASGSSPSIFGQYASHDECVKLSRAVFVHEPGHDWRALAPPDMSVECRLGFAFATVKEDRSVCVKAGLVPYGDITGSCDTRFGCDSYCSLAMSACGTQAYPSLQRCYDLCSYDHDIANQEVDSITDGDSSNCRGYHATRALVATEASTKQGHCNAVGVRASNGTATSGICGSDCDVYCRLVQSLCGTSQYDSRHTCITACQRFGTNGVYGDMDGDTLHCRLSHIISVATEAVNATAVTTACPIAGPRPPSRCISTPSPDTSSAWYTTLGAIIGMSVGGLLIILICARCAYKRYHTRRIEGLLNDEVAGWSTLPSTDDKW